MFSVFLLALALSADAFAVAFSYGLVIRRNAAASAFKLASATAAGQFAMPLAGWLATGSVHRYVEAFDHWIAFAVFLLLGLNVIIDARRGNKEEKAPCVLSLRLLFCIGIATSIDACVAGISLYFMNIGILTAALMIGIVCFVCTLAGFYISRVFHRLPTCALQIAAGVVLILLGVKILYEHLSSIDASAVAF